MQVPYEYDEAAAMRDAAGRIHEGWKDLREQSGSGHRAWLTRIKNHYARLIRTDPEAAAEMLATHEYVLGRLRKEKVPLSDALIAPRT